jgi:hypothetical protein
LLFTTISVELLDHQITPPPFRRDTMNLSDIEGSKPHYHHHKFATRNNIDKLTPSYVTFLSTAGLKTISAFD